MANNTNAITLNFDDITTDRHNEVSVPNGYGGLNWVDFGVQGLTEEYADTGYGHGIVSGEFVVYNNFERTAYVSSNSPFTFKNVYLTGAWYDNLNVQVQGYRLGSLVYSQTVVADFYVHTLFNFNFKNIDSLRFSTYGGSAIPNLTGSGRQFSMDNLTLEFIPEPSALMLLASFILVGVNHRNTSR